MNFVKFIHCLWLRHKLVNMFLYYRVRNINMAALCTQVIRHELEQSDHRLSEDVSILH